jgi:hypothetical protein
MRIEDEDEENLFTGHQAMTLFTLLTLCITVYLDMCLDVTT